MAKTGLAYNNEQTRWIADNCHKYRSYIDIANDFNDRFKTNKSLNAIQQLMTKKLGIHLTTKKILTHYMPEEKRWLICNYDRFDRYEDLTHLLNLTYGNKRTVTSVREQCTKRLGLKGMPNATVYQTGHRQPTLPVGTVRTTKTGYTYIKVMEDNSPRQGGYNEPYWLPIQKKVWADRYGEVPQEKMIIFLDGNKKNISIENLYCIDRKISAIMACNEWYTDNRDNTLTAIKWCELFYTMKAVCPH